jgi:hypothetical protein
VPSVIIVAESEAAQPGALSDDRRTFQLKERLTSADVGDPHLAAQLIERIGWALADAEDAESAAGAGRPDRAGSTA